MKKIISFALLLSVSALGVWAQVDQTFLNGPDAYLGQPRAGDTPEVFAKGIISLPNVNEATVNFSSDGRMCLVYIGAWPASYVMYTEFKNGKWTALARAWFSVTRPVDEPAFSADGKRIYFSSSNGGSTSDLYYIEKNDSGWGEPVNLGPPVNTSGDEFHPCVVADGSIYFTASDGKITLCRMVGGKFQPRITLPEPINLPSARDSYGDPWVAQDESFMLFKSNRTGGTGGFDDYVSFRNPDGSWGPAKNLGVKINGSGDEVSPDLSPDGKYLFFGKNGDVYWVKADFLKALR